MPDVPKSLRSQTLDLFLDLPDRVLLEIQSFSDYKLRCPLDLKRRHGILSKDPTGDGYRFSHASEARDFIQQMEITFQTKHVDSLEVDDAEYLTIIIKFYI